ncbi:MAG TPA: hypothetical protein VJ001_03755, partial [Rhodocyclaceae bacterium]|nr:hypothetical protein [Rhodocyclaceae bacterium]
MPRFARLPHRPPPIVHFFTLLLWLLSGLAMAETPSDHRLLLTADGVLWGWGNNDYRQLAKDAESTWRQPRRIDGLPALVAVATGKRHSLALDRQGRIWGWGDNSSGQLGLGHTRPVSSPTMIPKLDNIVAIAAGGRHSLALARDGALWVWGGNAQGQLGLMPSGAFEIVVQPSRVPAFAALKSVHAAAAASLALDADGRAWVWGEGRPDAQIIAGLPPLTSLHTHASHIHAFAIDADKTVWTWRLVAPLNRAHPEPSNIATLRKYAQAERYEAILIEGVIRSVDGKEVANAQLSTDQTVCAESNAVGRYSCVIHRDWNGALTVHLTTLKPGLEFPVQSIEDGALQPAAAIVTLDFTATAPLLRIRGRLRPGGSQAKVVA